MSISNNKIRFKSQRTAFTLVEMLIVSAIIVILIGLTLIASNVAATAAKETKTRSTIQKIDLAMQHIFEKYEDKLAAVEKNLKEDPDLSEEVRQKIAAHFVRDTMRMEMPQSWTEVYNTADPDNVLGPIEITFDTKKYRVEVSPLLNYYRTAYDTAKEALVNKEPNRAALLFLIIQNQNPEELEAFQGSEVGDTDGDGLLEFVDAWGNPIQFLRWAPAFSGSGLQPNILESLNYVPDKNMKKNQDWWTQQYTAKAKEFMEVVWDTQVRYPDPLDQRGSMTSWFLYPLIYSAGPDGKYDIISEETDKNDKPISPTLGEDGILDPFAFPIGMPGDDDGNGTLNHFDNIHNHQWYRSY